MKTSIKHIATSLSLCCSLTLLLACSSDIDKVFVIPGDDVNLGGATRDIVLDPDHPTALALTVYWDDNGTIATSDPNLQAPKNPYTNYVEMSASEDFTNSVEFVADEGVYWRQFTHSELNTAAQSMGLPGNVASPMYIRVKSVLGENVTPSYSNVLTVNVTPYVIDMTIGYVLNADKEETGATLYSQTENGVYTGFLGASAWYNWWLLEGNNTCWGNYGEDGHVFEASSESSAWNFWFPGQSGCYYTIVDTKQAWWSALLIPALTVSGDISGEMTYDRTSNCWSLTFDNASAGVKTVTICGTGLQYNTTTGTDDASSISTTVGFSGTSDALQFTPGNVTVNAEATGECTLRLDLSDPKAWTLTVESGSGPAPVTVPTKLYVLGIDDGNTGVSGWNFNSYITLGGNDETAKQYGGLLDINSAWGLQFAIEKDNWSDIYTMGEDGTAYSGSLVWQGTTNITKPDAGVYMVFADLVKLTYKLTAVTSVSYTGFNDNWSMTEMTRVGTTGCVYTAPVTLTKDTPWGFKITINGSWDADLVFGSAQGSLKPFVDGTTASGEFPTGSYTLTVDLSTCTYTLN